MGGCFEILGIREWMILMTLLTSAIPTIFLKIGETADIYHQRKLKAM
jgi:hypothetical protein